VKKDTTTGMTQKTRKKDKSQSQQKRGTNRGRGGAARNRLKFFLTPVRQQCDVGFAGPTSSGRHEMVPAEQKISPGILPNGLAKSRRVRLTTHAESRSPMTKGESSLGGVETSG